MLLVRPREVPHDSSWASRPLLVELRPGLSFLLHRSWLYELRTGPDLRPWLCCLRDRVQESLPEQFLVARDRQQLLGVRFLLRRSVLKRRVQELRAEGY